jgi:hypothetical protein
LAFVVKTKKTKKKKSFFVFGLVKMMLKIKRVPTVVSNYQNDAPRTVGGCGRNCLKACCIQGTICFFD